MPQGSPPPNASSISPSRRPIRRLPADALSSWDASGGCVPATDSSKPSTATAAVAATRPRPCSYGPSGPSVRSAGAWPGPCALPQPRGFEGLRMSQKVADANDLPRSKVKDFSDFLTELEAGRPGGQVDVTEHEDRLAEVAELLRPIGEAFPRLAAVLPPNLSRAVMTSVGGCLSLKARLDRRVPLDVGIELGQKGVQIIGIPRLEARWTLPRSPATSPTPADPRLRGRPSGPRTRPPGRPCRRAGCRPDRSGCRPPDPASPPGRGDGQLPAHGLPRR